METSRTYDQLPSKQSVDGSNPSGGVSKSNGSWRKLGAVFILRAQTGAQNTELSSDSRTGFNLVHGLPITAAVSEVLSLFKQRLHQRKQSQNLERQVPAIN